MEPVECFAHKKQASTIYMSSALKSAIKFPNSIRTNIHIKENVCIIPITLGVFLAGFSHHGPLLGPRTKLFEQMSLAGEELGFETIFFGHQHVHLEQNVVHGYLYKHNKWVQKVGPIPPVIYNRLPNRKIEHHPQVGKVMKGLKQKSSFFNDGFFNKWEIHEKVMKDTDYSFLLPETTLHPSKQKIQSLLTKYPLYIKPVHGSVGKGIVQCTKLENGELEVRYYIQNQAKVIRYEEDEAFFQQQFPNGFKGYVAQQAISLIQKQNSPIDFRVHANKNDRNSWEVTLIAAKFAGKGSLTTHVQRGGSIHTLEELFSAEEAKRIQTKLSSLTLKLCQGLERRMAHPVGEFGFDFGIDQEGKAWLFEANSKPGFHVFDHPSIRKKMKHILSYPYRYGFYLHNQKVNRFS
ncbi:YheC/YheD family endospore coat-associated protein [Radiobacillus deserti]|uniref:YheC/YheD family protein n=1 Tax=Radiobacillus deserti TaxID=2594883 RepID=A0A516KEB1_9BACI|nr:YheC/YheD family protein [Radiobacillus deserti]QDP39707.1 YheC/YheD family protein [Radiobacillus deserti]